MFKTSSSSSILCVIMAYRGSALRGLAVAQMVFGALMIVFGVASIFAVDHWSSYAGFGIWVGIWVSLKQKQSATCSCCPPPSLTFYRNKVNMYSLAECYSRSRSAKHRPSPVSDRDYILLGSARPRCKIRTCRYNKCADQIIRSF